MSLFTDVQFKVPKRRRFNRSFESHISSNFGELRIACVEECFPGDTHKMNLEASTKLAPLVAPSNCRIDVYYHWFFVPSRVVYDGFEKFITGGTDGTAPNGSLSTPVASFVDINDLYNANDNYLNVGGVCDEIGLPSFDAYQGSPFQDIPPLSTLPFLAYHKIFSDWYRDELLDASSEFTPVGDGDIKQYMTIAELCQRHYRAWKKDYFTSARPDTQLGAEESVPVTANIVADGVFRAKYSVSSNTQLSAYINAAEQETIDNEYYSPFTAGTTSRKVSYGDGLAIEDAAFLINDLRRSLKAQEWKEKNMRGGNRYIENIFNHFGVKSSDARLQRSQYLGGRKIPVVIGEVLQAVDQNQSGTPTNPKAQGARAGVGSSAGATQHLTYFSEEHGFLMCIMSIMPHAVYQQGIPRYLADRWDRFAYMWPEFGNIGEQEVYNWELYAVPGSGAKNGEVFGYQSRYADLKTRFGEVHGDFRKSLDFWVNARKFASRPNLNSGFVYFSDANDAGGQNRIFVVTANNAGDHFWTHLYINMSVLRQLPRYGIPSI